MEEKDEIMPSWEFTNKLLIAEDAEGGTKSTMAPRNTVSKNSTPKVNSMAAPPAIEPIMTPGIVHLIRYERL
jgi:hypothetical protein